MSRKEVFIALTDCIERIQPGERIKYSVPQHLYVNRDHYGDEDWNWEFIEEIQMFVRGPLDKILSPTDQLLSHTKANNLFITLRFSYTDNDLSVDMYFLPQ